LPLYGADPLRGVPIGLKPEDGIEARGIGVDTDRGVLMGVDMVRGADMGALTGAGRMAEELETEGIEGLEIAPPPPPTWPPPPPPPCEVGFCAFTVALTMMASRETRRGDGSCIIWTSAASGPRGKQEQYLSLGSA
jgi:hypothetical protein